jgi:hypothetical protein
MMDKEDIKSKVRERFAEKYPNTANQFKENMKCFVNFLVEEIIREMKK